MSIVLHGPTCSCGKRPRTLDESPNTHGPECCTCPPGTRVHRWGCLASYLGPDGELWDFLITGLTDTCPHHGVQKVTGESTTKGHDPYAVYHLECGHRVACFGPGEGNVILGTARA